METMHKNFQEHLSQAKFLSQHGLFCVPNLPPNQGLYEVELGSTVYDLDALQ